jgi:hypothetical protein
MKKHKRLVIIILVLGLYIYLHSIWIEDTFNKKRISKGKELKLKNDDPSVPIHKFDFNKDLLVSIEIQKTGTTNFHQQIINNLICIKNNEWTKCCKSDCEIKNGPNKTISDIWYYSYHRSVKYECGMHPDYTSLKHCISQLYPQKNLYYFTRIREPIQRYISEWNYVVNWYTWDIKRFKTFCEIKNDLCFDTTEKAKNVSLEEFANCPTNPGNNRMSRMLATYDHDNGECYGEGLSGDDMLERAKRTIDNLYWIGFNEYINESVSLFEKTLSGNSKFKSFAFFKRINEKKTFASNHILKISDKLMDKIKMNNHLDIQLYEYAHKNFLKRLKFYDIKLEKIKLK